MKNVTITLDEKVAAWARVEAAKQDKSLSRFIADLLAEKSGLEQQRQEAVETMEQFFKGPGWPGVSKNWRGREELYAEREDELLRRYEHSRLRRRSGGPGKAAAELGFAERDGQKPYARSKPAKSK